MASPPPVSSPAQKGYTVLEGTIVAPGTHASRAANPPPAPPKNQSCCSCRAEDVGEISYVGPSSGSFVLETTYEYVGAGHGEFDISMTRNRAAGGRRLVIFGTLCGVLTAVAVSLLAWAFLMSGAKAATSTAAPDLYNCFEDLANYEWDRKWPAAKKNWCCKNKNKGCPRDCLTQSCDATCYHDVDHKGHGDVTCHDRVIWAKDSDKNLTTKTLGAAIDLVNHECHCQCACTPQDFGAAQPEVGICLVFGKLHHVTFDRAAVDYVDEGTYWLVKTDLVHIQVKYQKTPDGGPPAMQEISFGGKFLDNHVLKVGPTNGGKITWDDKEILQDLGTDFDPDGFGKLIYDDKGQLIDPQEASIGQKILHVNFESPGDASKKVFSQVFRWENHLNVRVRMPPTFQPDGLCGNFNGNKEDDRESHVAARMEIEVGQNDDAMMFDYYLPRSTSTQRVPTLDDCDAAARTEARQVCAGDEDKLAYKIANKGDKQVAEAIVAGCMWDYCFGGSQEQGQSYAQTDVIEGW